jgi:hypothetical protein
MGNTLATLEEGTERRCWEGRRRKKWRPLRLSPRVMALVPSCSGAASRSSLKNKHRPGGEVVEGDVSGTRTADRTPT